MAFKAKGKKGEAQHVNDVQLLTIKLSFMPNFKTMDGRTIWEEEKQKEQHRELFDNWFSLWTGVEGETVTDWRKELESELQTQKPTWTGGGRTGVPVDGSRFKPVYRLGEIEVLPEVIDGQFGGVLISGNWGTLHVPLFILFKATVKYDRIYTECKEEGLPFAFYFLGVVKGFIIKECIDQCVIPYPIEECDYNIAFG